MMLDIPRLFASTFNAQASRVPLAWMIGHKLWYRSWHQVPAASLPNDDDLLCHLAELGFDRKTFVKAKPVAMRGWTLCDDGRLYHPVVSEAALEAWQEKLRQRMSSAAGNRKRWGVDFDPAPLAADLRGLIACMAQLNPQSKTILKAQKTLSQCDASAFPSGPDPDPTGIAPASQWDNPDPGISSQGTGTGTGTGILESEANASAQAAPPGEAQQTSAICRAGVVHAQPGRQPGAAATAAEQAAFEGFWAVYPLRKGRAPALKAFITALRSGRATIEQIMTGAQAYAGERAGKDRSKTKHAQGWLNDGRWADEPITDEPTAPRLRGRAPGWTALEQSLAHLRDEKEDFH